jgi:cytidine deaminase
MGHNNGHVDWETLHKVAVDATANSYSPYSNFPVGVAGFVDDGRVVSGANVENASYGITLCAECSMVSALYATGGGRLTAVYCVDGNGDPLMPCGRCRQLLYEHGGPGLLVMTPQGVQTMAEILPQAFGPWDLVERKSLRDQ